MKAEMSDKNIPFQATLKATLNAPWKIDIHKATLNGP